jgi:hypothetical protein
VESTDREACGQVYGDPDNNGHRRDPPISAALTFEGVPGEVSPGLASQQLALTVEALQRRATRLSRPAQPPPGGPKGLDGLPGTRVAATRYSSRPWAASPQ